ncbi:hypothetical protein CRE_06577 [Caenorhabditis remanei]|uniref:Uncharacterized protein n=1 Tax=Caenorhabditis remanei TaxID=31234 RepID=E3M1M2_CAERE|nr:hypothetical protein CRE_06577 [Caenorhabditis remanei]
MEFSKEFDFLVLGVPLALGYTYIMVPKALIHDVADYVTKKKQPEVIEISPAALLQMSQEAVQKAPERDGTAPGPSSVTSSDYSEDFDAADFVELCDEDLD